MFLLGYYITTIAQGIWTSEDKSILIVECVGVKKFNERGELIGTKEKGVTRFEFKFTENLLKIDYDNRTLKFSITGSKDIHNDYSNGSIFYLSMGDIVKAKIFYDKINFTFSFNWIDMKDKYTYLYDADF